MPTLVRFAAPTAILFSVQSFVGAMEIFFVSHLGTSALAGVSLVFPILTLMQMIAGAGFGGGVASAVARAVGAGRKADAEAVALHGVVLALVCGGIFTLTLIAFGVPLYRALGGEGPALKAALIYSNIVSSGAIGGWLLGTLSAVVRGTGDLVTPARIAVSRAVAVVPLTAILIFGWGPAPGLGVAGAAIATVIYYGLAVVALITHLQSDRSAVRLRLTGIPIRWRTFADILRVGAISSLQIGQMNLMMIAVTGLVGTFGSAALAGYGIASRLELLMILILSALGAGTTTMISTCIGANQLERAVRVTWIAAGIGGSFLQVIGLTAAALPNAWLGIFTDQPDVLAAGGAYLGTVGPTYGFNGLLNMLFFSSQGWSQMGAPFLTSLLRFAITALGGWIVVSIYGGDLGLLFAVVAISIVTAGLSLVLLVWFSMTSRIMRPSNRGDTHTSPTLFTK